MNLDGCLQMVHAAVLVAGCLEIEEKTVQAIHKNRHMLGAYREGTYLHRMEQVLGGQADRSTVQNRIMHQRNRWTACTAGTG